MQFHSFALSRSTKAAFGRNSRDRRFMVTVRAQY